MKTTAIIILLLAVIVLWLQVLGILPVDLGGVDLMLTDEPIGFTLLCVVAVLVLWPSGTRPCGS